MSYNWIPPEKITNPYREGAKIFQKQLLNEIEKMEAALDDEDAESHIWWNRVREFIKSQLK